jgi:type II secretory pathway pseudopilin PulG
VREHGFQLVELLVGVALASVMAALVIPDALRLSAALRVRAGAAEVAGALRSARAIAVRESANAAVKFRTDETGTVTFSIYRDGDGDGVLNSDIDSGVDPPVGPARELRHLGRGVRIGFPPGPPPRDPADPRRRLDNLEDPIRFNRSDLASFNPLGGSTPGSVYLTDSRSQLSVVRLFGITGKVRTLTYDRQTESWR